MLKTKILCSFIALFSAHTVLSSEPKDRLIRDINGKEHSYGDLSLRTSILTFMKKHPYDPFTVGDYKTDKNQMYTEFIDDLSSSFRRIRHSSPKTPEDCSETRYKADFEFLPLSLITLMEKHPNNSFMVTGIRLLCIIPQAPNKPL
jgi:hypothetical protein